MRTPYTLSDWLVLPTIVFSQFAGTSLWFAPNAVVSQVEGFQDSQISALVSCVQVGFIVGTLLLTYFALTDRVSPPLLFSGASLMGAVLNVVLVTTSNFAWWAVGRLLVGVCLAGIYPVGMKIAAMEYPSGLGARLGILVGALTLGTAFPWFFRGISDETGLPFEVTMGAVSALAAFGGVLMALIMIPRSNGWGSATLQGLFFCCFAQTDSDFTPTSVDVEDTTEVDHQVVPMIPNDDGLEAVTIEISTIDVNDFRNETGNVKTIQILESDEAEPTAPQPQTNLQGVAALKAIVASSEFRASAIGYFGHMWEVYSFWAFMPALISSHSEFHGGVALGNEAMTSFATIAVGALSSAAAGIWSLNAGKGLLPGSAVAAIVPLIISGGCCLLAPIYQLMSEVVFLCFLLVWGAAVVADSAQFSSLTAMYAHPDLVGTSLTLTASIGFAISIVSLLLVGALINSGWDPGNALVLLACGPAIGTYRSYREWPLHRLCCGSGCTDENKSVISDDRNDDPEA